MGTYYLLVNKTKKEEVHFDSCVKMNCIQFNEKVHFALINYMLDNMGDELIFVSDDGTYDELLGDCKDIDLKDYEFYYDDVNTKNKENVKINKIERDKFIKELFGEKE